MHTVAEMHLQGIITLSGYKTYTVLLPQSLQGNNVVYVLIVEPGRRA